MRVAVRGDVPSPSHRRDMGQLPTRETGTSLARATSSHEVITGDDQDGTTAQTPEYLTNPKRAEAGILVEGSPPAGTKAVEGKVGERGRSKTAGEGGNRFSKPGRLVSSRAEELAGEGGRKT